MTATLTALAAIVLLGVAGQAIAWRLRVPGILVLLVLGFIAGPVTGFLDPDALLGDLLQPIVGLAVAVILFEGGLALNLRELRGHGSSVTLLVTAGVLVTWLIGSVAAYLLTDLGVGVSLVLGAVLVVSGPTVVMPLLRHVRPKRELKTILTWEGILIDPIGALLTAIVVEIVVHDVTTGTLPELAWAVVWTITLGSAVGLIAGLIWVAAEKRFLIPDFLTAPAGLALVIGTYLAADLAMHEAGFFAVTVLGITLATQTKVSVRHLLDFKEVLTQLLLGSLFIVLAARIQIDALLPLLPAAAGLLAVLVLVARPLAVAISTSGAGLAWRDKGFLAWMAPRGIVAAAVSAFFALRLEARGVPGSESLVPLTFAIIVGSVMLYGLTARPVAQLLRVAEPPARGVLLVGVNQVTRAFARVLNDLGVRAVMVGSDTQAITAARVEGLEAVHAKVHSTHLTDEVDLSGIGQLWAITPDAETNALAAVHFADEFGRAKVFQVAAGDPDNLVHQHLEGRTLFKNDLTYGVLRARVQGNYEIRRTAITTQFRREDHKTMHPDAIDLWVIDEEGRVRPFTPQQRPDVVAGRTLVSMVPAKAETPSPASPG